MKRSYRSFFIVLLFMYIYVYIIFLSQLLTYIFTYINHVNIIRRRCLIRCYKDNKCKLSVITCTQSNLGHTSLLKMDSIVNTAVFRFSAKFFLGCLMTKKFLEQLEFYMVPINVRLSVIINPVFE